MSDPGRKGSDEYIPSSNGATEASLEQNKPAPSDLELLAKLEEANRYVQDITVILYWPLCEKTCLWGF